MIFYINRFIYRLTMFFKVIIFNIFGITFQKVKNIKGHNYKFFYYSYLQNKTYKVVFDCTHCHKHKVVFLTAEKFQELKNRNFEL